MVEQRSPRVLMSGAGTGGHLYPGIAVAQEIRRRHPRAQVVFAGAGRDLEARALDITPGTIERFLSAGDAVSARMLGRIMSDEIRHVAAGTKWFGWAANGAGLNPPKHYQNLVIRHFRGTVKPPFNDSARRQAGLTTDFYHVLASGG